MFGDIPWDITFPTSPAFHVFRYLFLYSWFYTQPNKIEEITSTYIDFFDVSSFIFKENHVLVKQDNSSEKNYYSLRFTKTCAHHSHEEWKDNLEIRAVLTEVFMLC